MNKLIFTAAALGLFASAAVLPQPAMAQGTDGPIQRHEGKGACPSGWTAGFGGKGSRPNENLCYKGSSGSPAYHIGSSGTCAAGYTKSFSFYCIELSGEHADQRSAADRLVSYGTITKANRLDRCPLGHFSKSDMTTCTTRLSPAPKSRKKKGPCNSNEIDEWGLWCTADANVITREQAEMESNRDFNAIYSENGATSPLQDGDLSLNAAYGRKGSDSASTSSSSPTQASSSTDTAASAQCATGSASGAAVGGALAGDAGAALGSMLGGLGKKKKKQAGC